MSMYRTKIVCMAFFAVIILTPLLHAENKKSNPVSQIKERSFDFGQVKEGILLEHSFFILNKGNKVLKVDRVKTS